jgi:hypothetical protein
MDLLNAKASDIKIEGIDGSDGLVEKAVAAVYSNTLADLGDDDTKKPFLVMVLWRLYTFWHELCFRPMLYCLNRLNEIAPTGFDKARLLLLSQCRRVSPPDFVPRSNADPYIISNAITLLIAENNGKSADADKLIQQLSITGRYNYELERNTAL